MKHFFISYNSADRTWAEWIAWQLEEAGYTTVIQAWDFRPGSNFVLEMQRAATQAERTIAVLSPDYLAAPFPQSEWAAAFRQDPTSEKGTLLPVRIRECELEGLLPQIIYIDLVGQEESDAQNALLAGVHRGRAKPTTPPGFPGAAPRSVPERPRFPGDLLTETPYWKIGEGAPMSQEELRIHYHNRDELRRRIAMHGPGEAPLFLHRQLDAVEETIRRLEAELLEEAREKRRERWPILLKTPRWIYVGCLAVIVLIGALTICGVLGRQYLVAWLRTPTPTKTTAPVLSPTSTDTPTLTPTPSSTPTITPTPTPYYVEIVVDASERMSDEFEGGTTKMESAWQAAGTIARIRAQQGQFVSIRTFGSGGEQTDMGCFESYSVFPFTNQDSEVKAHLMTSPIPGGQAAVVTALTDASADLMAYENIGREIVLLTGGDDECGSALLTFYDSENRSLWTQTFVVLFASGDFGPFVELRARGADINYNLVKNAAQAEKVAQEISNPPTLTPTPSPTSPPSPTTGVTLPPTSTPKPPSPSPTGRVVTTTHTPTPTATKSPTHTGTPTDTPTPTGTATSTPTLTATKSPTHTSTPTDTPIPTPEVEYDPGSHTITIHPGDAQAQTGRLCKGKMADVSRNAVFLRAAYLQEFGEPAGLLATVTHVYPEKSINITLPKVEVGQYNDNEINADGTPLNYRHCAFNAVQDMRDQLGLPSELGGLNDPQRFDHGTITIQLSSTPFGGVTEDRPSVEPGIFAASDQANMASQASAFRLEYRDTAAINGTAFSPGSDDNTSYRIAYDRVDYDHWALWGIVLSEIDVSSLSRLAFDIKGQSGGEIPNVWLVSPDETRNFADIVTVSTDWQRVEIPLADFRERWSQQQTIDLTRIIRVEIVFEWEDMAGMVYVDGFAFEP